LAINALYQLKVRSRRPRQVIDDSDSDREEVDEEGEYSGGEDLNAEFVSMVRIDREQVLMIEHRP
jgi:hypothetical protein